VNLPIWLPLAFAVALSAGIVILGIGFRRSNPRSGPLDERSAELLAAGLLPLADCPLERNACLRCLQVDRCIVHRLLELGLTPGTPLRVVQDAGGPMVVSVRGSRIALGRELAQNLWVELPFPLGDETPSV
jgi:Fe2+ transport system protein FeoA